MKKDIKLLIERFCDKYREKRLWKKVVCILSCIVAFFTVYSLISPAMTLEGNESYTLYLRDNYDYSWKTEENGYTTSYDLNLIFMDTSGNYIEGRDVEIEIGPDKLEDAPYGFGDVPFKDSTTTETRGQDLIETLDLEEYITSTGEKYKFDHAEVYVDGAWQVLSLNGMRWHIWCQNSSSETEPIDKNYSWRGRYGDNDTLYTITNDTEYKFVYRLVRYGDDKTVTSLGADSGIKFKMFNYFGDNDETGINNNGIYDYFTFRDSSREITTRINTLIDGDGFKDNRARVLTRLDEEGYPVFDCQGICSTNPSLGYLFGSATNPVGVKPDGVIGYNPTNTLLQKETDEDGVEYYYYDSNRNAVDYDIDNNRFLVRNYVERAYSMSTYAKEADRYEFLPFNYLNDTLSAKINTTTNLNYNYEQVEKDSWYGMTMEFEFYMPKNGMLKNKDMIFEFSGDDDVWVFIDDVLVLDLGGTHGAVDGSINFNTGKVEAYLNWNDTVGDKNETSIYESFMNANGLDSVKWNESNTTFANYTKHTLKFFYLERGAAVANCKIRFNIPVLPSGSLSVQKQFEGVDSYNDDYEFVLYDVTADAVVANAEYTVGENKFTTDEGGRFKLKNNEVAIFKLINDHKYYVEEVDTGRYAVSSKCSFDDELCPEINKTLEFVIDPESTYQAVFINKIKTYDLNVSKIVYDESDETFDFKINLSHEKIESPIVIPSDSNFKYTVNPDSGEITFSLKSEESITIKEIPIDTKVIIQEVEHDGYQTVIKSGDETLSNGDYYEFTMNGSKDITVHNIPGIVLPETGGSGIWGYLVLGILLVLISLRYGYSYYFRINR